MKKFKQYHNLYAIYRHEQNKMLVIMIIMLVIFLSAVVTLCFDIDPAITAIMMIMIIPTLIIGIFYLFNRHFAVKAVSRFTAEELERVNNDILSAHTEEGFSVTRDAVVCRNGRLFIYPVRNILWVYKNVVTTNLYGVVPVAKNSTVVIVGKDKKLYNCRTKNKSNIVAFLQSQLQQYRRGIFYGYSPDIDTMFRKDFGRMLAVSEEYDRQQNT
ncbi:MAG: hypothetical protein J1E39_08275 [Eubacterium sp.]|nr:hypothetical protein [Eubacterium sp.]